MSPDEQEALSRRYAVRQYILRLASGNYAVIGCYNYTTGDNTPILFIGPWSECEAYIHDFAPPSPVVLKTKFSNLDLTIDL